MRERSLKDDGILKLVLYLIRNIAMIAAPRDSKVDTKEAELSRSAAVDSFHDQDIFHLLLIIASGMGTDFSTEDVLILEILFHLLKGINADRLFMDTEQLSKSHDEELLDVLRKEKSSHSSSTKRAPTRHNRFGTMIWLDRGNDRYSTITGQQVLADPQNSFQKLDNSKKWNKPNRGKAGEEHAQVSRRNLRAFGILLTLRVARFQPVCHGIGIGTPAPEIIRGRLPRLVLQPTFQSPPKGYFTRGRSCPGDSQCSVFLCYVMVSPSPQGSAT